MGGAPFPGLSAPRSFWRGREYSLWCGVTLAPAWPSVPDLPLGLSEAPGTDVVQGLRLPNPSCAACGALHFLISLKTVDFNTAVIEGHPFEPASSPLQSGLPLVSAVTSKLLQGCGLVCLSLGPAVPARPGRTVLLSTVTWRLVLGRGTSLLVQAPRSPDVPGGPL